MSYLKNINIKIRSIKIQLFNLSIYISIVQYISVLYNIYQHCTIYVD